MQFNYGALVYVIPLLSYFFLKQTLKNLIKIIIIIIIMIIIIIIIIIKTQLL